MSDPVMKPTTASVEDFLQRVEPAVRRADAHVLIEIMRRLSGEEPVMWGPSIIGFGHAHLIYESGRHVDIPLLGFSPRKASHSIYLCEGFGENKEVMERLGPHRAAKACLYVTRLSRIDLNVLEELLISSRDIAMSMDRLGQY